MRSHGCFLALNGVFHSFWPLCKLLTYVEEFSILWAQAGEADNGRLSLCQAPLQPGGAQVSGFPTHPPTPPASAHTGGGGGGGLEEAALVATGQRWECGLTRVWGWHWDLGGLFGSRILSTFWTLLLVGLSYVWLLHPPANSASDPISFKKHYLEIISHL